MAGQASHGAGEGDPGYLCYFYESEASMDAILKQLADFSGQIAILLGGGALGTLVTVLTTYKLNMRKQADGQETGLVAKIIEQSQSAMAQSQTMIALVQDTNRQLETRITKLETDHQDCTKERINMAGAFGEMKGELSALRAQVAANTKTHVELASKV